MSYQYRLHLIRNQGSPVGHAIVELRANGASTYHELNVSQAYREAGGPFGFLLAGNPPPGVNSYPYPPDGVIRSVSDRALFDTAVVERPSGFFDISQQQHDAMLNYANSRAGTTDYHLTLNSCITFVDGMLQAGGVSTPLAAHFNAADVEALGPALILAHPKLLSIPRPPHYPQSAGPTDSTWFIECFLAGTAILMADGSEKPIEQIRVGDLVMSFDPAVESGRGPLLPAKVTRLFRNVTEAVLSVNGVLTSSRSRPSPSRRSWRPGSICASAYAQALRRACPSRMGAGASAGTRCRSPSTSSRTGEGRNATT